MSEKRQTSDRHKGVYISLWIDTESNEMLTKAAIAERRTKSEILRRYTDKGLKDDGYRPDDERLRQMIMEAVQEIIKPHVERLASISAKAANIDAASFFLQYYIGRIVLPPHEHTRLDEAADNSRHMGIEYLKLRKDRDLDAFIRHSLDEMRDE